MLSSHEPLLRNRPRGAREFFHRFRVQLHTNPWADRARQGAIGQDRHFIVNKAGPVTLTCRLNKSGLTRRKRGVLTVTRTTIYTPTGGAAQTTTQKVKVARA